MKHHLIALPLALALAGCAAPDTGTQSGGGSDYFTQNRAYQAAPARKVAAASRVRAGLTGRALRQAAEQAMSRGHTGLFIGSGTFTLVTVADRTMAMRVVEAKGESFAVLQERGVPLSLSGQPNLSREAQAAAARESGCLATGNTYTRRYANGAFPKYAVHLQCG